MDALDRSIINALQGDFPVCDHPFAVVAGHLGLSEEDLIQRIQRLLDENYLTRFGPLFNADQFGGAVSLCAMKVPKEHFDKVAEKVNAFSEVAHNYQRDHELNMWFVLAAESQQTLNQARQRIEQQTGLKVLSFPKREEFYVGLYFEV